MQLDEIMMKPCPRRAHWQCQCPTGRVRFLPVGKGPPHRGDPPRTYLPIPTPAHERGRGTHQCYESMGDLRSRKEEHFTLLTCRLVKTWVYKA